MKIYKDLKGQARKLSRWATKIRKFGREIEDCGRYAQKAPSHSPWWPICEEVFERKLRYAEHSSSVSSPRKNQGRRIVGLLLLIWVLFWMSLRVFGLELSAPRLDQDQFST